MFFLVLAFSLARLYVVLKEYKENIYYSIREKIINVTSILSIKCCVLISRVEVGCGFMTYVNIAKVRVLNKRKEH